MRKTIIFIVVAFLLLCAAPVYASEIPALPHAFYGDVSINGGSAPIGTTISADGDGVKTNTPALHNPVETTKVGSYGIDSMKLLVQGDILDGATITFYVNGHVATTEPAAVEWHSEETTRVDLSVTIAVPPSDDDGAPAPRFYIETTLCGVPGKFQIDMNGKVLQTVTCGCKDSPLTVTIPKGTIALDKDGDPLDTLDVSIDKSPPDPPEGAHIIGLPYVFSPEGATFDPAITFTWSYDPDALPKDVAEEDLVLAYYDEDAGKWVELDCVVDTKNNVITASVSHFTTFAIIARAPPPPPALAVFYLSNLSIQPAEVEPKESVTITLSVANTGGTEGSYTVVLKINGVKEAEKRVTIAAGRGETVSFTVSKEQAGSYSVVVNGLSGSFHIAAPPVLPPKPAPPAPAPPVPAPAPPAPVPFPWPLVGGIIAAVIVVALLIYFFVVRRILVRG